MVPEKYRELVTFEYLMEPISHYAYVSTIEDKTGAGENLGSIWPADLIAYIGSEIFRDMTCTSAWRQISRGSIAGLLDTVRNRILGFVLDVEAEAPDAGEVGLSNRPVSEERISQIFNTTIIEGNVANLAAGSQTISHETHIVVVRDDLDSLKKYLMSHGVDECDLEELEDCVREDAESGAEDVLGDKVGTWIRKMINKAAKGTWDITTSLATKLLTEAFLTYYGVK